MFTVMGLDPGTNNFAYSVVEVGLPASKYNVLEHGMLKHQIKEMSGLDIGQRLKKFAAEIRKIKRAYNVQFVVAERYMTRGHGGTTIEAISTMLGCVSMIFGTEVVFIPASQWKNAFNKHMSLDRLYSEMGQYGIPTHRVDAVGIGLYGATLALEEPHYPMLKNQRQFKKKILDKR